MIKAFENLEVWFVTGAQLLYGGETVKIVDGHSKDMVDGLNNSGIIPIKVVYKGTANSSAEVEAVMKAANNDEKCVGIITWMHTFSPAKMWIKGLQALEASPPLPHSVQCRTPLGFYRYGFHEPQPVSPRRHRVRSHLHPYAHP